GLLCEGRQCAVGCTTQDHPARIWPGLGARPAGPRIGDSEPHPIPAESQFPCPLHKMFTCMVPAAEKTPSGTNFRAPRAHDPARPQSKPARGDAVIKKNMGALACFAVLAIGIAACGSSSSSSSTSGTSSSGGSATISGAGSTFAAPVYQQWASSLSPLTVNYQSVGSGAGITALESKTVDFGASDPALKPADETAI